MKPVKFGRRAGDQRASNVAQFGRGGGTAPEKARSAPQPNPGRPMSDGELVDHVVLTLRPLIAEGIDPHEASFRPRGEVAAELDQLISDLCRDQGIAISDLDRRDVVTALFNDLIGPGPSRAADPLAVSTPGPALAKSDRATLERAKERIQPLLMEQIDPAAASEISRQELAEQIGELVGELLSQEKFHLNLREQRDLVTMLLNDMLGLGPLEPLLADETITDIMVNGPKQVYVERKGKLEIADIEFRDNAHLMNVATRIVSSVGRRVDESSPLCDARLADGSRVNIIIPPLAIDGASISIRKFAKQKITLDVMMRQNNLSRELGTVLKIASAARLNILISGGTGSGKTTLLNALSQMIDHGERIVTIEDAAELQLQQPHVVRLETRPPNLEGCGEITMRDLVKNALRMRPDRIILGEIRSSEALDMLQAMNTGHDGSMCTIHANRPREALTRLENMVGMAGINLPSKAIRTQIASAIDVIVQIARMRDGMRRILQVTEVVGMEGDIITTQDLFVYKFEGEDQDGNLLGRFQSTGVRPHFTEKAQYYGLDRALMEVI
ncbi:MAG: CpaF family protein [Sphingomonadales bacterium]